MCRWALLGIIEAKGISSRLSSRPMMKIACDLRYGRRIFLGCTAILMRWDKLLRAEITLVCKKEKGGRLLELHGCCQSQMLTQVSSSYKNDGRVAVNTKLANCHFTGNGTPRRLRESWPFCHIEIKGDFFNWFWAEIFLQKSLADSGISHRFLC